MLKIPVVVIHTVITVILGLYFNDLFVLTVLSFREALYFFHEYNTFSDRMRCRGRVDDITIQILIVILYYCKTFKNVGKVGFETGILLLPEEEIPPDFTERESLHIMEVNSHY